MKLSEYNSTIAAPGTSVSMKEDDGQNVVLVAAKACSEEDLTDRDIAFGKYLQEKRVEKKLTVRQLAAKAKISYAELSRIENGKPPTASTLRKLSPYLSIPIDTLLEHAGYCLSISHSPVYLDLEGNEINLMEKALKSYKRNVEFFFELDDWIENCSDDDIALVSQFLSILKKRKGFEQKPDNQNNKNLFQQIFSGLQSLIQACSAV